jgi:hypothetical protein
VYCDATSENRFRLAAEECLLAARKAADPNARIRLLIIAQQWFDLAAKSRSLMTPAVTSVSQRLNAGRE